MSGVFELLQNVSLLAKTVSADAEHVDFVLNQLEDPGNFRPLKSLTDMHDRDMYCDPRSGQWQQRFFSRPRQHHILAERKEGRYKKITWSGYPKNKLFTKKNSTTLLPPYAKIQFYQPAHKKAVGFLFDINRCDLKNEKYIFPKMANTDERWWLYHPQKKHLIQRSIALETLRMQLRNAAKNNQTLAPNELLVGLSRDALVGIFSPVNTRESRLQALVVQQKVQKKLKINVPIFIIDQNGMRVYSERRQKEDIREAAILNDPLFRELQIYSDASLFEEKSVATFPLEELFKTDAGVSRHIPSFLSLSELAALSQTNQAMRSLLNRNDSTFLWHNSLAKKITMPSNLTNKHDLALYYEKSLAPSLSLATFARRSPEHAYRIMQSQFFSQQLPAAERRQLKFRSSLQKSAHGFLGFFIGFGIGLVMTIFFAIEALLRTIGMLCTFGLFFKTSFVRSLLGTTIFPIYSLAKSSWYGAIFGWKYGLRQLDSLLNGLLIFHSELYYGTLSGAHDPWTCCGCAPYEETIGGSSNTDLWQFFEQQNGLKTIAEIALEVHAQKPESLMSQSPYAESVYSL